MNPRFPAHETNHTLTDGSQYTIGILVCACSNTFGAFMAGRIIHAAGSGVCEALPIQCVTDLYFLHERGKRIGYYTVALCLGSIATLPAGYMLAAGYSFRLFYWIEFGVAVALLFASFFLVPETSYKRRSKGAPMAKSGLSDGEKGVTVGPQDVEGAPRALPKQTYLASLKPWSQIDPDVNVMMMVARSFTYYLVPQVLWVITSYGSHNTP
jgi:MFS family permease